MNLARLSVKTILLLSLLLAITLVPARGQALPAGDYTFRAELGTVFLDGRYPLSLRGAPAGYADLTTQPGGAITGTVTMLGSSPIVVTGAIKLVKQLVQMRLTGKAGLGGFSANYTLRGRFFVGSIRLRGKVIPAEIDAAGVGPIDARYAISIASSAGNKVTGAGMVSVGRQSVPVVVKGSASPRRVTFTVSGGKTFWQGTGVPPTSGPLAVDWLARGFGGGTKGRALTLAPQ